MRQVILKLLRLPSFDDDEKNRVAKFLHSILLVTFGLLVCAGAIAAVTGKTASTAATGAVLLLIFLAYAANRVGHTGLASYILLLGGIAGLTLVLAVGQGIHDIGMINYGLILILASYLLRPKGILIVTAALILSVAFLVFGEFYGWLPIKNSPEHFEPEIADFFIITLFLIIHSIAILLLSSALHQSIAKTKSAELRWRSLVNSIPEVIAILDTNGNIQWLNRATTEMAAFYMQKSVFELLTDNQKKVGRSDFESVLAGNTLLREIELRTMNDQNRWFEISLGPIHQPDGTIRGVIAVARDIQEKKDAEADLKRSREALHARTKQLEILQEISRGVASLKDLHGTLLLALEQIKIALPLDAFVITFYDEETNMLSFPLVYDDGAFYQEEPVPLYPESVVAQSIYQRKTHILNRTEEEILHPPVGIHKRIGTKRVSKSVITAPMVVHDQVIGTISAHSYSFNTYTEDHAEILSGAASQIGIAIENARLYETSRARAERLATLNEIGRSISALHDLTSVLESTYHLLQYILPVDAFYIALYDVEKGLISYPIMIDNGKKWEEPATPLIEGTHLSRVILTGEPYLVNRSREEITQRQTQLQAQNSLGDASTISASLMIAPLQFGGKVIGAISAQSYKLNAYSADDLELLAGVGTQVAIAIQNTHLYTELQKELAERKRAEDEIRTLNKDLEMRVRQRTSDLEAANKELASFTYTVSHDLRAPLRGIHGLTYIILDEFRTSLPEPVIANLQRIQTNAHQMGLLIDELLAFTHLGRQTVRKTDVDMETLTHSIIAELMKNQAHSIEFIIQALPQAHCDLGLVRQALTNLISNAIKFSSKQAHATIEIGSFEQNNETVYFVRDNGAGFDMAYADKLFGVFERLHRQDEFEGTGVGLAIVKRIINKHGGRIWAQGEVNQGATFFFTLPQKSHKPRTEKRK